MKIRPILWLFLPAALLLGAFIVLPSFDLFRASVFDPEFTTKHFQRLFERGVYLDVMWRTIRVSLMVAVLCTVIGYPVAFFINLQPRRRQTILLFLILIPMWMSILIRTYAWIVVLGRDGLVNEALAALGFTTEPVQMLFTSGAVLAAMVQILLPIQILTCYAAMTEIDLDLIRAARVLGARPRQALARVFLPLSLDGTLTGLVIIFMLSMGFFITPALLGGRQDMMIANLIEFQVQRLNWSFAAALGVVLLVLTVGMIVLLRGGGRMLARRILKGGL
ncbi:Spermidine/putrescine transport system permease protein PotB (plasmid) [Sulfitobacter sp. THAF37]|uniref:ABC transporter permease n=1 Tax=Sulfitobacter sp. THAF37 TaxID=2587855 RepID=UPI00126903DC|nr:ABC transporter permease [Sulfitobacter sp. THAF37]QFT61062.1 Spermidine/putrescine transport system permease protein PotB [Sulfitobacter sp. THAF37]